MSRIKNDRPPVVYEDGLQSRDFVSVEDVVEANLLAMERSEADGQIFNVGTGRALTIRGVAEILAEESGAMVLFLDPLGGSRAPNDYLGLIRYNVRTMAEAMK